MQRGRVVAIAGATCVLAVALGVLWSSTRDDAGDEGAPSDGEASAHASRAVAVDGLSGTYRFSFVSEERVSLEHVADAEALGGALSFAGTLKVAVLSGAHALAMSVSDLEAPTLVLGESDLVAEYERDSDEPLFDGRWTRVELSPDGAVARLQYEPDAPILYRQAMRAIVLEVTQVVYGRGAHWETSEQTAHGVARSRYDVLAEDSARGDLALERRRARYARLDVPLGPLATTEVDAVHRVSIEHRVVRSLEGTERIDAREGAREVLHVETRVSLHRTGDLDVAPPRLDVAALEAYDPARAPASDRLTDAHLAQQIDGLDADTLVDTLARFGNGGVVPDHHRFLYRAIGLLRRDPEVATSLGPLFLDEGSTQAARALVLDLLCQAQTTEARAMMAELLGSDVAQGDPAFADYLQRVGFVEEPDASLVTLTRDVFETHRGDARRSAAYVVGTLAERLARDGRATEADALLAELHDAARDAAPDDLPHVIRGIGNARSATSVGLLADLARDGRVDARMAVADALGQVPGEESRDLATAMLDDNEPNVRTLAIDALAAREPDRASLEALAVRLESGALGESSFRSVLALVEPLLGREPALARRCLEAMIAQRIETPEVRTRAYALLDRLSEPA